MKKRISVVLVVCLVLAFSVSIVIAQPQSIPNGPWLQPEQYVSRASLPQPEDVEKQLFDIEKRSKGRMKVEVLGYSAFYEYPIYVAKFGEPDENKAKILIDTQIHGGEPLGTPAVLDLIQHLATSGSKEVEQILDNVVIWFIPMLNKDGATIFETESGQTQQRQNIQWWTPEEWGLPAETPEPWYHRADTGPRDTPGYDINRDAHPYLDFDLSKHSDQHSPGVSTQNWGGQPGFYVTPEARALRDAFKALMPDVYINHHHRGSNTVSEDDNSRALLQICAQFVPLDRVTTIKDNGVDHTYTLTEESLELSYKVNALVYEKLQLGNSPFAAVTKYRRVENDNGGEGLPGTTLASFSMNGAAVMLYEVSGIGQKQSGMLTRQSLIGIYETIKGFATGEVYDIDPDVYDYVVPESGPGIRNP